jgi:hypothetical protein
MGIKVCVYVPTLGKEIIAAIVGRFSDFGMECEFQPGFELNPTHDSGLVMMRLRVLDQETTPYENTDLVSSFEIGFKDFRYTAPVSVNPAINEKLKGCTKQVIVRMNADPTNSLRAGLFFASFLAEATRGIVYTPRSDQYVEPEQALEQSAHEVANYEDGLAPQDWITSPFTAWPQK